MDGFFWYALYQLLVGLHGQSFFCSMGELCCGKKAEQPLHEPHVNAAITTLKKFLANQGWFIGIPHASSTLQDISDMYNKSLNTIEPLPDFVYATAENNSKIYDANNDSQLAQEEFLRRITMERELLGLEDRETQERKPLFLDVHSPVERLEDAFKLGQSQTGGIFRAGVSVYFPNMCCVDFCLRYSFFSVGLYLYQQ